MVAKRAGQFAGGFLNNPGALAAIGIVVSIITTLVIFRNDIRDFFSGISEGFGNIDITLPTITFPDFPSFPEFPTITLPSFPEFPDFPVFPSFEDIFGGPPQPGEIVDGELVPGELPSEELGPIGIPEGCTVGPDGVVSCPTPPTFDASLFVTEEELAARLQPESSDLVSAAIRPFNVIAETQEEFQERAGLFVEALPEVTAFTSLPGAATDFVRRQISRNQEDFQALLDAEARRSETIFAGLFGNVQNPEFGA